MCILFGLSNDSQSVAAILTNWKISLKNASKPRHSLGVQFLAHACCHLFSMTLLYRITFRRREGEWKAGYLSHLLSALFFSLISLNPRLLAWPEKPLKERSVLELFSRQRQA